MPQDRTLGRGSKPPVALSPLVARCPHWVTAHGVYQVALIRRLTLLFGMTAAKAVSMAAQWLKDGEQSSLDVNYGIELRVDRRLF